MKKKSMVNFFSSYLYWTPLPCALRLNNCRSSVLFGDLISSLWNISPCIPCCRSRNLLRRRRRSRRGWWWSIPLLWMAMRRSPMVGILPTVLWLITRGLLSWARKSMNFLISLIKYEEATGLSKAKAHDFVSRCMYLSREPDIHRMDFSFTGC